MSDDIKLFNPYHDKLGRFTTGPKAGGSQVKDWIGEHKKEIIIGAGIATAVGIAGITAYAIYKGRGGAPWEANVDGDAWSGNVYLHDSLGRFTDDESQRFLHGIAVAQSGISAVGVDPVSAKAINGFTSWREYADTYLGRPIDTLIADAAKESGLDIDPFSDEDIEKWLENHRGLPHGFTSLETKIVNLSPRTARRIVDDTTGMTVSKIPEYSRGITTAMHELIHARSPVQHSAGVKTYGNIEEGLTDWATGDALRHVFPGIKVDNFLVYGREAGLVAKAAHAKSAATGQSVLDIRKSWLKSPAPWPDIAEWLQEAGLALSELLLFNPYHDKLGRFAAGPGVKAGKITTKYDGFDTDDAKQWVKDHKRAIIGGAAILAGVGIAAYVVYNKKSEHGNTIIQSDFLGRDDQIFTVDMVSSAPLGESGLTSPESVVGVSTTFAVGKSLVDDYGIETVPQKLLVYDSPETYFHEAYPQMDILEVKKKFLEQQQVLGIGPMTAEQEDTLWRAYLRDALPAAFTTKTELHVSPVSAERMYQWTHVVKDHANLWAADPRVKTDAVDSIELAVHELIHNRASAYDEQGNKIPRFVGNRFAEEGLTEWTTMSIMAKNARGWGWHLGERSYGYGQLWFAVAKGAEWKAMTNDTTIKEVRLGWLREAAPFGDIQRWCKAAGYDLQSMAETMQRWDVSDVMERMVTPYGTPKNLEDLYRFSELQLFNPYHDELGRFTASPSGRAGKITAKYEGFDGERGKQWIKDHKKEIALGAGLMVAAGVVAYMVYKKGDDGSTVCHIDSQWTGDLHIEGGLTAEQSANVMSNLSSAASAIEKAGIDLSTTKRIIAHTSLEAYEQAYNAKLAVPGSSAAPYAWAWVDEAHLSPRATLNLSGAVGEFERLAAIGTCMHELAHTRYPTEASYWRVGRSQEEAFVEWAAGRALRDSFGAEIAASGHQLRDFLSYGGLWKQARWAAGMESERTGETVDVIFRRWAGSADLGRDMGYFWARTLREFADAGWNTEDAQGEPYLEFSELQLFNPYHDKLGRFTTGPKVIRDKWNGLSDSQKRMVKTAAFWAGAVVVAAGAGYVAYRYYERKDAEPLGRGPSIESGYDDFDMAKAAGQHDAICDRLRGGQWSEVKDGSLLAGVQRPVQVTDGSMVAIQKEDIHPHQGEGRGESGREEAYYVIARELGYEQFVPPTVSGPVPGSDEPRFFSRQMWIESRELTIKRGSDRGRREAFIMDSLSMHRDRHGYNRVWDNNAGHEVQVDNSYAFPTARGWPLQRTFGYNIRDERDAAVNRLPLNRFEQHRILGLWSRRATIYPKLTELVGPSAAKVFFTNVQYAVSMSKLPPTYTVDWQEWRDYNGQTFEVRDEEEEA